MSDVFQIGEEVSRGKFVGQLEAVRAQGENVLTQIEQERLDTLVTFERRLSAMNGRRQRANRVMAPKTAVRFAVSDFLDIDQAQTTATVRADAQAVTLRERQTPADAVVRTQRFSVSNGTAESMDTNGKLYRAYCDDGSVPTGTFELELVEPFALSLLVFDLAAMPSDPTISVEVSATGGTYVPATQVNLSGYRLNAWIAPQVVRFIRINLTPSHPDTLGGRTYTFGLMDFVGSSTEFHLLSELVTRSISFRPVTKKVRLAAANDPGLTYFLSFDGGGFIEVRPGDEIDIPGASAVLASTVEFNAETGLLAHTFTGYPESLQVTQDGSTDAVHVIVGMSPSSADARLTRKYVSIVGSQLFYIRNDISQDSGKKFTLHYTTGPASVTVQLKVQLTTSDRTTTPVFRGAVLEEI